MTITDPFVFFGRLFFACLALIAGIIILVTHLRGKTRNAPWQIGFKARAPEKPGEF